MNEGGRREIKNIRGEVRNGVGANSPTLTGKSSVWKRETLEARGGPFYVPRKIQTIFD